MGLFGSLFSQESSSVATTTANNYDQRVASDNAGIAIGPGASYSNELSQQVVDIFNKMVDFSAGIVTAATNLTKETIQSNEDILNKSIGASESALGQVVSQVQRNNEAESPTLTSFIPYAIGIVVLIIFMRAGRK
ncbi:MAG: hypothetical protein WC547_09580 [Candidatus Omnitrophota bacterium]